MPVAAPPTLLTPASVKPSPEEMETAQKRVPFSDISLERWAAIGEWASTNAQAELHRKGLSYFIGRDDLVIEVLPSGEEKVCIFER